VSYQPLSLRWGPRLKIRRPEKFNPIIGENPLEHELNSPEMKIRRNYY
jgi:hypothetical protein